jgi:hypothetical protein
MAIDTTGLLTSVMSPSQRSQQRMGDNLLQARSGGKGAILAGGLGLADTMTNSLSNLVGADTRSPEQIAGARVTELLQDGSPESLQEAVRVLRDVDPAAAVQLIGRINAEQEKLQQRGAQTIALSNAFPNDAMELTQALEAGADFSSLRQEGLARQAKAVEFQQNQQIREQLSAQARDLGLTAVAEQARQPGFDIQSVRDLINNESLRRVVGQNGRQGKLAVARNRQASSDIISAIENGEMDGMEFNTFLDAIQGANATTQAYVTAEGEVGIYRENEEGRIWSDGTDKWVEPSSLGLQPAPVRTETLSLASAFQNGVGELAVKTFGESYEAVKDSAATLANGQQAYGLLDAGIRTGSLAELRNGVTRLGITLGRIDPTSRGADLEANTDAFLMTRAGEVGRKIQLFGSGTGLSDKDREYAEGMSAGSIRLTEQSIRRLLAMEQIVNTEAIINFNQGLEDNVAARELTESQARMFRIEAPSPIPREAANFMIDGQPQTVSIYEVRPGRWVTGSGIPIEQLQGVR